VALCATGASLKAHLEADDLKQVLYEDVVRVYLFWVRDHWRACRCNLMILR
jgi:hypothetical protein